MPQYPQCCVEYGVTTDSAIYGTARLCSWNYSHRRTFSFNWDRCFILVFSWRQMIWNPNLYLNCLCLWCRFWFRRQPHSMWPSIALNGPSVRMCSFCSFVFLFYFRILFTIYMVFLLKLAHRNGYLFRIVGTDGPTILHQAIRAPSQDKDGLSIYDDSHYKYKIVVSPSYLYIGIPYSGKMVRRPSVTTMLSENPSVSHGYIWGLRCQKYVGYFVNRNCVRYGPHNMAYAERVKRTMVIVELWYKCKCISHWYR